MRTLTLVTALMWLAACGDKKPVESGVDLAANPAANFQAGLNLLNTPDKKTGVVDYAAALNYFVASSNLGGGAKAHFNAGWTAERLGNAVDAEKHYRAAFEADPAYQAAMFSLARILTDQKKHTDAVGIYKVFVDKNPTDYEVRNDYIAALIAAKSYEAAVGEAQEILRHDPKNAGVYRNLSAMYYATGNYGMSQLCAEKALGYNAGDVGTYNNMGVTSLQQGDEPEAIEKFKTALKLSAKNFEANMNLGWVALNSGDYKLAEGAFILATEADAKNVDAMMGLAISKRGVADFKAAGELYDKVISFSPDGRAAYYDAAILHEYYTKDFARAQKYLQTYIDTHQGAVSPTDEIFQRMERINLAKQKEQDRIDLIAAGKKLEQERIDRAKQQLKEVATAVAETKVKIDANKGCLDPGMVEEMVMVLEQGQMIVDAEEYEMAVDIKQLLDAYIPQVDEGILVMCTGLTPEGEPAPVEPAPEGTPTEGAAPVEGSPPAEAPATESAPVEPPAAPAEPPAGVAPAVPPVEAPVAPPEGSGGQL